MTIIIGIASFLALLMCPILVAWNLSLNTSDAATDGLAAIYTIFGTLALWTMLAVALLLIPRGGTGTMPRWQTIVLLLLSCGAALAVTFLLDQGEPLRWMLVIQTLVPLLLLAYIAWVMIPRVHSLLNAQLSFAFVGGTVLALSLLPWTRLIGHQEWQRRIDQESTARRAEWQRQFDRLTPQSPLHDWMEFLDVERGFYDEAVRRIKALDTKQSGIEQMLNTGDYTGFGALWQLDLAPAAALSEGVRKFLRDQTAALKPTSKRRKYYPDVRILTDSWQSSLQWFSRNGCPMANELDAFEATLRAYPDIEKEGSLFLGALDEMKNGLRNSR